MYTTAVHKLCKREQLHSYMQILFQLGYFTLCNFLSRNQMSYKSRSTYQRISSINSSAVPSASSISCSGVCYRVCIFFCRVFACFPLHSFPHYMQSNVCLMLMHVFYLFHDLQLELCTISRIKFVLFIYLLLE
jgi:hypothetical protein